MPLVKAKPTSPGRRFAIRVVTPGLHKGKPWGPLTEKKKRTGGRNNKGRITVRHRGGGGPSADRICSVVNPRLSRKRAWRAHSR